MKKKLAAKMRKYASLLDTPGAARARQLRVPLPLYQFFGGVRERFPIRTVLDIGANRGAFSRYCVECFPDAAIHAFEPLPLCQGDLQALAAAHPRLHIHACALGDATGTHEMFENEHCDSSSLLVMADRHRELWPKTARDKKISVTVETLDRFASGTRLDPPIFLKADVQGYELAVLRGGVAVLPRVAVVMLEVLFEPLYERQTNFRELLNFLGDQGFEFSGFVEERRWPPHNKLVYADAAFVNTRLK